MLSEFSKKIFLTYNYEKVNWKEMIELSNIKNHFIGIGFFDAEIFDENNLSIGNVVYNYFIQEIKENKFAVRYDATFFIEGKGTISWKYDIIQKEPVCFYSLEELIKSRIISTTGLYEDIIGKVFLYADKVGNVFITIMFNESKTDENIKTSEKENVQQDKKIFEETKEKIFEQQKKDDETFFNNNFQSSRFSLRKSRKWS